MLNLVFQMGKSEMERKGNFAPSYLSFPVPFRPFQINPAFLSLSEKNGQLSGKGNIAFLSLTCMKIKADVKKVEVSMTKVLLSLIFAPKVDFLNKLKQSGKNSSTF